MQKQEKSLSLFPGGTLATVSREMWQTILSVAPIAVASRMFGVTEAQAAMVMLKGFELGLGLASSFEFIHTIDSKPGISPKGALALIHRSGELAGLRIQNLTDPDGNPTRCKVWMERANGVAYETEFSMDDAKRAGLTEGSPTQSGARGRGNWEKYPANMLRWRAVGYCADVVFPDVCGGLYRLEELGAVVDEEGEVVKAGGSGVEGHAGRSTEAPRLRLEQAPATGPQAVLPLPILQGAIEERVAAPAAPPPAAAPAATTPAPPAAPTATTINDILVAGFSAEQIMVANEGRIPATSEECEAILRTLKGAGDV